MSTRAIFGLYALATALCASGPSTAQYYYGPAPQPYNIPPPGWGEPPPFYGNGPYGRPGYAPAPRPLSARAVVDRLEDLGFDDVGHPRFTGTLYVVAATAPGGLRQQLTVDAVRGIILNRVVIGRVPDDDDDDDDARSRLRYGAPRRGLDPPRGLDPRRGLDSNDVAPPRRAPERREASRAAPGETPPRVESVPRPGAVDSLPLPPPDVGGPTSNGSTAERPAVVTPRPFEGRSGERVTRVDPRPEVKPNASRPFGINPGAGTPSTADTKKPDGQVSTPTGAPEKKGALPPRPAPKATAEARPQPSRPVRVIPGVPVITGPGGGGGVGPQPDTPATPPVPKVTN